MATEDDAAAILDIYRPIVLNTAISFERDPPSEAEMRRRIRTTLERYPWLVAVEPGRSGRVAAYAYATQLRTRQSYQWSVEVSAYVRPDRKRRGMATSLYDRLLGILERQGFVNALAAIALPNPDSVAFHERFGFEPVGVFRNAGYKLGRWHDIGWWELELRRPTANPASPVPLRALAEDALHASRSHRQRERIE